MLLSRLSREIEKSGFAYKNNKFDMKRYNNLYDKICTMENLRLAHQNARRGKGWYTEVKSIDKDPEFYLKKIQDLLLSKTYKTSAYTVFYRHERGKTRKIYKLPYYPDRIVHWAILQVIEPYLVRTLIRDTYSAIPNRGVHDGLNRIKKAIEEDPEGCRYCLKLDIHHYYQSINHEILKSQYRRIFKDSDLLWLLDEIIDSVSTSDSGETGTGIPIGNYLSQYSANLYLSQFDHWIKEIKGVKHYFRYMDDMVILSNNKSALHKLKHEIITYLRENLKLAVKSNIQIFPSFIRGIDFLGYRIFEDYVLLRKSTAKAMKKKALRLMKKGRLTLSDVCCINSYKGWLEHANAFRLYRKYIQPIEQGEAMKHYKDVESTARPNDIEVLETKVFTYENVRSFERSFEDQSFAGFVFDMTEYEKDEYIHMMAEHNKALQDELISTQLALVEVYELGLEG